MKELDVVSLLNKMNQMDFLAQVFLNKHQVRMLQMQKKHVVEMDDESEEESIESSPMKAMHRKMSLFGTLGQIRMDLNYFIRKNKLNLIDKRLLVGIF